MAPVAMRHLDGLHDPARAADKDVLDLWQEAMSASSGKYQVHGFSRAELERWAWPEVWMVLALMAWGLWCSFRRGWKQWARCKAPLPWVLMLFALVVVAGLCMQPGSTDEIALLSLASLAVLLSVFGIADVARSCMERLVLAPPQERDASVPP